jgi:aspartyl-tRNA(Asn)/glutamyl-tRNA(Gln) amidotransferase subunit A
MMQITLNQPSDILEASIAEVGARLRRKEISSEELTRRALDRAVQTQPTLNAFIAISADSAIAQAKQLDLEAASGKWRGPLHGIPLAHKDCFEREGLPMTVGSKVTGTDLGRKTASALQRLNQAGAVDLGPLNMNEMVAGPTGQNPHFGNCCNSWDPDRISGGSSSGSGSAVGAGVIYGALASDTGGSTRLPASMNGLFGMKGTYGRVSRAGCFPRAFSLDCVGPIARSAEDCAILLQALAGWDPLDASSIDAPVPNYLSVLESAGQGSRWAVLEGIAAYHPEIERVFEFFIEAIQKRFGDVGRVRSNEIATCYAMADIFSKVEAATLHGNWMRERRDLYSQAVFSRTEPGLHVPAVRYLEALQMRAKILHEFLHGTMRDLDILVCPTMPIPVPTHEEADVETPGRVFGVVTALTPLVRPFNYLGLPSLTMPIGVDSAGMPIGAQLVGRPFAEARLLSVAHQLTADIGWNRLASMQRAQALKVKK